MANPVVPARRRGVALGVLGTMLLAFFSLVFMLGRHSYFHDIYEHMVHDPRLGHHEVHLDHATIGVFEHHSIRLSLTRPVSVSFCFRCD
jgi:hypothetical protein